MKPLLQDGFPRTVTQAKDLDTFANIDRVVNFVLNEDILKTKLLGRR